MLQLPDGAHPATAGRVPATDAGCGLSTRGHWGGPAICTEWKGGCRHSATCSAAWRKVPCEHANSPYLGPATVQYLWLVPLSLGSSGCASVGYALDRICGSVSFPSCACGRANTVLYPCFGGSLAKMEVYRPPGIVNIFTAIAACYVYECIQGNRASLWHHVPLWSAGEISNILLLLCQLY